MLITERKVSIFNLLNIYFADHPLTTIPYYDILTYHTYKNWGEIKGYEKSKKFTSIINLNQDIDVIWNRITRQHKRHIRRAEKNGIKVTISNNYEGFFQINKTLINQKNHANIFGINILSSEFMKKYGILFIAEYQDEIMGGNFYVHDENNALLMSVAYSKNENNIEYKKMNIDANCFLNWEAIQYFKNKNMINYYLGDVSTNQENINIQMKGGDYFKRSFGGDVIFRYEYRKFNSFFTKSLYSSWNFFKNTKIIS
jgi:hypothetical protein